MFSRSIHIVYSLLLFALTLWSMEACIDDSTSPCEVESIDSLAGDVEVCLNVTVYPPDAIMPADTKTRGDEDTDDGDTDQNFGTNPDCHPFYTELNDNGTVAENLIRSITVFMVDLDNKGYEQLGYGHVRAASVYVQSTELGSDIEASGYLATLNLKTSVGNKHVYVGANLSDDQIECFRDGNRPVEYPNYSAANLKEIMSNFMTLTDDQFSYTGSLISMFAQGARKRDDDEKDTETDNATNEDFTVFEVKPNPSSNELQVIALQKLQLERTVSKVVLSCIASDEDDGCIAIQDLNETLGINEKDFAGLSDEEKAAQMELKAEQLKYDYRGWAPKTGVFYMVNMAARTQRLLKDSIATYGNYLTHISDYDFVATEGDLYTRRYLSYSAKDLDLSNTEGTTDDGYVAPFFTGALRRRAEIVSSKLTAFQEMRERKEGLYCLPNLFRFRKSDTDVDEWYAATDEEFLLDNIAKKIATYMLVAVRYVPRTMYCLNDADELAPVRFEQMSQAEAQLDAVTDSKGNYYPRGTYWALVDNNGIYSYTYGAMKKYLETLGYNDSDWALAQFRCYKAGYGYFITFIDPANCDGTLSYDYDLQQNPLVKRTNRVFGLERNHYYLLSTDDITVPGASALSGTMRLNAVLRDWDDQGSTEVEITPYE